MKKTKLITLLLLAICCSNTVFTQTVNPVFGKYDFSVYTTEHGLGSSEITCFYQDAKGYLWIGTDNGLSCFDGKEFANYTVQEGLFRLAYYLCWRNSIQMNRNYPGI